MKNLILITLILLGFQLIAQNNTTKLLACCDVERGCTGSAYCTACTNCTGCKYCAKSGGSCGVCSNGSMKRYTKRRETLKKRQTKRSYSYSNITTKLSTNTFLYVTITYLNLRNGPGTKYKVLSTLSQDTKLTYLDKKNGWIKVKVIKTGLVGYVYYKYLY